MINIWFGSCCSFFSPEVAQQHPLAAKGPATGGLRCCCIISLRFMCGLISFFYSVQWSNALYCFTYQRCYIYLIGYYRYLQQECYVIILTLYRIAVPFDNWYNIVVPYRLSFDYRLTALYVPKSVQLYDVFLNCDCCLFGIDVPLQLLLLYNCYPCILYRSSDYCPF